ncbi:unnamed protein product [Ambrosiozyma monospora]|uniref:Unnamed protein product n=1 Tax=Ambrosiozyma monospora TaxID=43982 RepID=A0ACB5SZ37_AMBMO|nr:unnamed protein product [Ambrosiozyma monospora]
MSRLIRAISIPLDIIALSFVCLLLHTPYYDLSKKWGIASATIISFSLLLNILGIFTRCHLCLSFIWIFASFPTLLTIIYMFVTLTKYQLGGWMGLMLILSSLSLIGALAQVSFTVWKCFHSAPVTSERSHIVGLLKLYSIPFVMFAFFFSFPILIMADYSSLRIYSIPTTILIGYSMMLTFTSVWINDKVYDTLVCFCNFLGLGMCVTLTGLVLNDVKPLTWVCWIFVPIDITATFNFVASFIIVDQVICQEAEADNTDKIYSFRDSYARKGNSTFTLSSPT